MSNTLAAPPPAAKAEQLPEVAFVRAALHDLRLSQAKLPPGLRDRWIPTAFNHWYCPAVRRGYVGGMSVVFDIGVMLMEPIAELRYSEYFHGPLLQWIREKPFIGEFARRTEGSQRPSGAADETRGLVTWIMVEPLLRCLSGVWNSAQAAAGTGRELPSIELRNKQIHVFAGAYETTPVHKFDIGSIGSDVKPVSVTGCVLPTIHAISVRLFAAQIARLLPETVHKLDHELVDACLLGPLLGARDHEPPRRSPSDVATTRQSNQPGTIAGVTRVEVKRPTDPVTDILPSELMILRRSRGEEIPMSTKRKAAELMIQRQTRTDGLTNRESRMAGLAHILYGKPLVVVHEREWDVVPKHRALVCYIVDAHQDISGGNRSTAAAVPSRCAYRDGYVYAKRQVFDTLHDLAEAQALARRTAEVVIEAAVFAIPPGRDNAVVHQRIPLQGLKRGATGDGRIDRLTEMVGMAERIPGYFIRYAGERDRPPALPAKLANDVLPPDVARYLRGAAQHGRYRVIHLVLVGIHNASRLLERLHRHLHYQSATPIRITLIGADLTNYDTDARLGRMHEPAWTYTEAGSLRDAIVLDAGGTDPTPLAELRARLVESVFGKETEPSAAQLNRIRID